MHSISCLYIGSLKYLFLISDPSEFLLTSIAFITQIGQEGASQAAKGIQAV